MSYPITTGQGAAVLGVTEPQLSETVRRGKVRPAPWIVAGRRLWFAEHLIQAATALGILTPKLQAAIDKAAPLGGEALARYAPQAEVLVQEEKEAARAS